MESRVGAVLLAAGGSSRMGEPKQLLRYRDQSLLRHAAEVAVASACQPTIVVLGAHAERMEHELAGLPVCAVTNPDWERGIGASIRVGIQALASEKVDAAVLLLCDQAMVTPTHIDCLIETHRRTDLPITASLYQDSLGVPALFARRYFERLLQLPDHEGAKRLILAEESMVCAVPFPEGAFDVDTRQDYARLK